MDHKIIQETEVVQIRSNLLEIIRTSIFRMFRIIILVILDIDVQ